MAAMMAPLKSAFEKLQDAKGIYVKQSFEFLEALTGCESPNVYKVYPADVNG